MDRNTKTANQAWRRKPRKFAPKSRLGCKTCKIRRVKCDLARPSCVKCRSTGRTCDGYGESPLPPKTEIESSRYRSESADTGEGYDSRHPRSTISSQKPTQWQARYHGLMLQSLGPFMVLPATGPAQTEAMCFFEYISVKHLNEYRPCNSWRETLMYFSQTVPSVRHAAIALALIHRNYLDRNSSKLLVRQTQSSEDVLSDKAPLLHYNRAIQLLLDQDVGDSTERTAITLLVCYLFTCFDHLAGNYVQAVKHLRGGVELLRGIDKAVLHNTDAYRDDTAPSSILTLISQVTRQIRRLDMQAVMFLVDWTPVTTQETPTFQLPLPGNTFRCLDEAGDHLQILVTQVMELRNAEHPMSPGNMPQSPEPLKDIVLEQLETWSDLFENMLRQSSSYETDPETNRLISLLRLQHTTAWTFLSSYGPGKEMEYDSFLPQFRQCVALASDVAAAHERYSGSLQPTFSPEIGIIPALYIIGVKCRHPVVRREALSILRRQPIREAVWDSICTAKVIERVIDIEEGGAEGGRMIQSMEHIAVWRRIETLSWVHVVHGQSAPRLDISYTFCTQEGTHTESLII